MTETLDIFKAELDQKLLAQKVEGLKRLLKELGYAESVTSDCTIENVKDYALSMLHNCAKGIVTINIETLEIERNEKIEYLCRDMGKMLYRIELIPERYDKFIDNIIAGSIKKISEIKEKWEVNSEQNKN